MESMDRISGLSDELLIKILLFLPTKTAVSTSLLSRRWEFLWMWLPRLEYNARHYSETEGERLRCFLDRNLGLHRAPVLESLCLGLNRSHFKPEDVKLCVLTAVSLSVCELDISYYSYPFKPAILPNSLYACKSLVTLKFNGTIFSDVPRSGCLASLKTLQLQYVRYNNEDSFERLLSICPVLKHLSVDRCSDDDMGDFRICMRSLETLSIYIPGDCHDGCLIYTPSLKHFKLEDYNSQSYYCLLDNMPELCEADVVVEFPDITSLMESITAVKRLSLSLCSQAMYGGGFVFNRLKHLLFNVCKGKSLNLLVRLLKDSPNLRVLDLDIDEDYHEPQHIDWWNQPSSVPECLLSSLETFKWSGYQGTPQQRDCVVYILENARRLKTVTISSDESEVPKLKMIQELSLSSRASAVCRLAFD